MTSLTILKSEDKDFKEFFRDGHPNFLIPDFDPKPSDIWITYLDYRAKQLGHEVWDQDGGEVENVEVLNLQTGLTRCTYAPWVVDNQEDDEDFKEKEIDITGFVVRNEQGEVYFLAHTVEMVDEFKKEDA